MSGLGPAAVVRGPAASPAVHGLVASLGITPEPDDRWANGFTWDPESCQIVQVFSPDCPPTAGWPSPGTAMPGCVTVHPVVLDVSLESSSLYAQADMFPGIQNRLLEAGSSKALEHELWTGVSDKTNQYLATPTATVVNPTPGTAVSLQQGVALLEQAVADCSTGGRAVIHATVRAATLILWDGGLFDVDGKRLASKATGSILIPGAGYPGTGPDTPGNPPTPSAAPAAGTQWMYATGMVQVRLTAPDVTPGTFGEALDRRTNKVSFRAWRNGAANFDPCCGPFAVLVNLGN